MKIQEISTSYVILRLNSIYLLTSCSVNGLGRRQCYVGKPDLSPNDS